MAEVLTLTPDRERGVVRARGRNVPDGTGLLTRQAPKSVPQPIRGGDLTLTTGGFIREDPEAPFGEELTYRLTVNPSKRHIQSNRVSNPKFKNNTTGWTDGTGRTLARETDPALAPPRDGTTSLRVGPNQAGGSLGTIAARTLAGTAPLDLAAGRWFMSGQVRYDSPDIWLWEDVKTRTWAQIKALGSWQQVKSNSSEEANQPFASLWAAILGPTKTPSETRRNRVSNPTAVSTGPAWGTTISGGSTSLTYQTGVANGPAGRTTAARMTWTAAATGVGGSLNTGLGATSRAPVTPGETIVASIYGRCSRTGQSMRCRIQWYDGAGAALSTVLGPDTTVFASASTWYRLSSGPVVVPAGAASARIDLNYTAGALWQIGDFVEGTAALLEKASVLGTYFDALSAAGNDKTYAWAGTAYNSASIETTTDYPVVVQPFQVLGVQADNSTSWRTFQAWVDIPAGAPAGSRLVFLQGPVPREYAVTWWLTTIMVTPEAETTSGALLPYFDGDSALPANPAENLAPGGGWETVIQDASIVWSGTNGNSPSIFTGPSTIAVSAKTKLLAPDTRALPRVRLPILLSDPIVPQVRSWFELVQMGDLSFAARQDLFDVIGRGAQIAVSSQRGWATGEFRLMTYTLEAASVAERMFAPGRILFLRNPDPRFPETAWYLAIGNVTQGRPGPSVAWAPERLWSVPFARVERPVGLIAATTGISWADIKAGYTWESLRQQRSDWLDAAVTPVDA